jgi:hypothetical protein
MQEENRKAGNSEGFWEFFIGGADGIRTHDLLDAIEARSQLRHGPTELQN